MKRKILVTPRSLTAKGHPALNKLSDAGFEVVFCEAGKTPSEDDLVRLVKGCVGYLAGVEKITARVLESADQLKVISRNGTGIDNIDLAVAEKRGIRICRAENANARGVAELAMTLILALVRSVPFSDAALKKGEWSRREGIELENAVLGLVGCGRIGRLTAQFALGMGMKVVAYDPFPDMNYRPSDRFSYVSLDQVWSSADVISFHCPPAPDGKPLVTSDSIARMKKGVYMVNTARAGLMDDAAVLEGLNSGRIAGLAVDVYHEEPPKDLKLVKHERVIATPHIGGFTAQSVSKAVSVAVDNLISNIGPEK